MRLLTCDHAGASMVHLYEYKYKDMALQHHLMSLIVSHERVKFIAIGAAYFAHEFNGALHLLL